MVQFRVIYVTSAGRMESWCVNTLLKAYQTCLDNNQDHWHVKVFPAIQREVMDASPQHAVRVAYKDYSPQRLNNMAPDAPLPPPPANYVYEAYYIHALPEPGTSIYIQFPTNIVLPGPIPC